MRVRLCLLLSLLGAACVDLSRPPELTAPRPGPGDAEGSPGDSPDAAVDVGAGVDAPAPVIAEAGAGADLPVPADTTVEPIPPDAAAPEVALPADAAALPKDSAPLPADAAPLPPDAAPLPPDAAPLSPDLAPDLPPPPPDLAPDLAPDLPPPPPDLAPDAGPPPLVVDDFQTAATMTRNNLNSEVTWDHENCTRASGEMACTYTGSGQYHDFIESLASWCSYDASKYRKLRFRLRTSVAGEQVDVFVLRHLTGGCNGSLVLVGTITTTTAMTTYDLDLTTILSAGKWLTAIEFDPRSTNSTQFIYDDIQLVP